ncbi:MAG: DUF1127 domain-containing protein [Pseudomonadota bacterium]
MLLNLLARLRRSLLPASLSRARAGMQRAQLRAMSDLELRDLGVGRSEIPALLEQQPAEDGWGNRYPK